MSNEPNFSNLSELEPERADARRSKEVARAIDTSKPDHLKDGRMLSGTLKDAGELSLTHGLKRIPKGWQLHSPSGDADHVNVIQTGSDANIIKVKNLGATGTLNFQLWVY
jgi:hypothetical protein